AYARPVCTLLALLAHCLHCPCAATVARMLHFLPARCLPCLRAACTAGALPAHCTPCSCSARAPQVPPVRCARAAPHRSSRAATPELRRTARAMPPCRAASRYLVAWHIYFCCCTTAAATTTTATAAATTAINDGYTQCPCL
ncbi:unnamed protein product, partial [Closterium sp. NIES-53]